MEASNTANFLLMCLYVDDLLVTGSNKGEIYEFKYKMKSEFELTDLGNLSYLLAMKFVQTKRGIL